MNQTVYEKGMEKGMEKGEEKGVEKGIPRGKQILVEEMLEDRFGAISEETKKHLETLSNSDLRKLVFQIPNVGSIEELGLPK